MCGSATLAIEVSSTSMKVASVTVIAMAHGLWLGFHSSVRLPQRGIRLLIEHQVTDIVRIAQKGSRADKAPPEVLKLTRRMNVLFRDRLEERLRPLSITSAQLQLLAALTKEPGTSGAHISRFCQVTPQTTHALLAVAEQRGWVQRSPDPENAHTLLATVTPQGRRLFSRGKQIALKLHSQMLSSLSAAEVRRLEATLARLIENLN